MSPRPDLSLSSLLTNVWENREAILFGVSKAKEAVGDRVYDICGGSLPQSTQMTGQYQIQLSQIDSIPALKSWKKGKQADQFGSYFIRYTNPSASGEAQSRLYINAKRDCAFKVFKAIVEFLPPVLIFGGSQTAVNLHNQVKGLGRGRGVAMQEDWTVTVLLIKIADVEEAFRGRRDLIVVYLNLPITKAAEFGRLLGNKIDSHWLNNDVMPMTQQLKHGLSVGAEVHDNQWKVGTSFTEVRCYLIAQALIECVVGKSAPATTPAPMKKVVNVATANRLIFVDKATQLLKQAGIDPAKPWL